MALIEYNDLHILQPATAVRAVSQTAAFDQQMMAAAKTINSAANSDWEPRYMCEWNQPMMDDVKTALEGQGYKITQKIGPDRLPVRDNWIISWKA